ncbi:MAG: hypothetical protein J6125_02535, partial [Clostridia bacterium]|nr:hypothetical protein [Clostridia bacterium]
AASRPAVDVARARLGVMFDGRVFLTGVPGAPGLVFYSERDPGGRNRPDYIGVCNFVQDGNAETENVAMSATSERLLVYKGSVSDGASVCCHTPESTGQALTPRVYPSETGTMGPGCVGCAVNFLDDTVFVSPRGLEATILSRVTGERSLCHRSTTVDARLSSEDLSRVRAAEWNGYLLLLVPGGRVYMADSRRTHTAPSGDRGYEWFLLDGIGAWREDTACFAYAGAWPEGVASLWSGQQELRLAEDPDDIPFGSPEGYLSAEADGRIIEGPLRRVYTDGREDETTGAFARTEEGLFLLRATDERIGGRFVPAAHVAAVRDSLWLATAEGDLLVANTDKAETVRLSDGSVRRRIPRGDYHICRHRYLAGAVTAADCAGIPHLTKHTDKRGTVVRTKSMPGGRFCLRVRTDRDDWQTVGYAVEAEADFADTDMSNAGFSTGRQGQVCFREKTRRWIHKQYALYSDGYARPFGFGAVTYRCGVAGRIKN